MNLFRSTILLALLPINYAQGVEVVEITEANHQTVAPSGKEADWIYGDYVIRNDKIAAVVAQPIETRNANMTVRDVAGAMIDLTFRYRPSDQLSCFYPGGATIPIRKLVHRTTDDEATITVSSESGDNQPEMQVEYKLAEGESFITVTSTFSNPNEEAITFPLRDSVRADRGFTHEIEGATYICEDIHWRQAYGVQAIDHNVQQSGDSLDKGRPVLDYVKDDKNEVTLEKGETYTLIRRLSVGENAIDVKSRTSNDTLQQLAISVTDANGFVPHARVAISRDGETSETLGSALAPAIGPLMLHLPSGDYTIRAVDQARGKASAKVTIDAEAAALNLELPLPGFVVGTVVDGNGKPIPAKIQFRAKDGDYPDFGSDTQSFGVKNLQYTANGQCKAVVSPGDYELIISRGTEYDADFQTIKVERGETTSFKSTLQQSVDSTGWVSTDYHSHSSPSGDNTSDQLGRVLNLLAEHIEFAPCTEHNRISSYEPHLVRLNAKSFMATCTGMELTGKPLPVNHQNAFPLHHHPHTQDGGGPTTHSNPVVQIERLAMWDEESDKLLQQNHPNLERIWADQDLDGVEDEGFEKMFGFMDVMEVHPPADIFAEPGTMTGEYGNVIHSWIRMLNKGYRIPGVVNTDAHYNFHGSGWLRNYVKSSSDLPNEIDTIEMVHQSERGHVVMTNGPFLEVTATSGDKTAIAGDDLAAEDGKVTLAVKVQCPNWFDINRVQVLINGRLSDDHHFTRRTTPDRFSSDGAVKFEQTLEVELEEDAHLIVATIGDDLKLGVVMGDERGEKAPVALTNPIFVDIDGDGFKPNGDLLGLPFPYKAP